MKVYSDEQQAILNNPSKHLLIRGCPGSGKTHTLIGCIAQARQEYDANRILVASFGKKDAEKLTARLELAGVHDVKATTFHSRCYKIVWDDIVIKANSNGEKAKRWLAANGALNLVTGRKQLELVEKATKIVDASPEMPPTNEEIEYEREIERFKAIGRRVTEQSAAGDDKYSVYLQYQRMLRNTYSHDFGELLLKAEDVLNTNPDVADKYRYDGVFFDEAMDFTPQMLNVAAIFMKAAKKVVVSIDDFQSIFSFRSAVGDQIEGHLRSILPDLITMELSMNHRSSPAIVEHAEMIFQRGMQAVNADLKGTVTVTDKPFADKEKHAADVVTTISQWQEKGVKHKDMAILCRTRNAMPEIKDALVDAKIPVTEGDKQFTDLPEIKDLTAWLVIAADPKAMLTRPSKRHALWRVYAAPRIYLDDEQKHWLGKTWEKEARDVLRGKDMTAYDVLSPARYHDKWAPALLLLQENIGKAQERTSPGDILSYVVSFMKPSCYYNYQVQNFANERLGDPMDNINSFIRLARKYPDTNEFLSFMKSVDRVLRKDSVELNSVHSFKGREAEAVIGVETIGNYQYYADWQEEKRIQYVCQTRPTKLLAINKLIVG